MTETDDGPLLPAEPPAARPRRGATSFGRLAHALREQNWFSLVLEIVIVFVGVALAFGMDNLREQRNERAVADQYVAGFMKDLRGDLDMLASNIEAREAQVRATHVALAFYEGRELNVDAFFEAFYPVLHSQGIAPNRNTMDEVLNSGSLRLISDPAVRGSILNLYAHYDRILGSEAHIDRDFETYLYDRTFSAVPFQHRGPWAETPGSRLAAEKLIADLTIENGLRLVLANVEDEGGLLDQLRLARSEVDHLLQLLESE